MKQYGAKVCVRVKGAKGHKHRERKEKRKPAYRITEDILKNRKERKVETIKKQIQKSLSRIEDSDRSLVDMMGAL